MHWPSPRPRNSFDGLSILITETAREAAAQSRALAFFSAEQDFPILNFPDWETLPYDIFLALIKILSPRACKPCPIYPTLSMHY